MASTSVIRPENVKQHGHRVLQLLDTANTHTFVKPTKRIHEGHDVPTFLTSHAYRDIGVWVMQLNLAMCPRRSQEAGKASTRSLDKPLALSDPVEKLQEMLQDIELIIEEAPPDTGPRRFGNISFKKWYALLETRVQGLLEHYLPKTLLEFPRGAKDNISVLDELTPYLLGGFGSSQRLDYGTGHELSFLAFLGCIWKLGGFGERTSSDGELERSIVIGIIEPYLRVVRNLILTYTLEPAGSHGVWGLDDHFALPYIFGSAQCCPAITDEESMPIEGSLPGAPDPGDVAKKNIVDKERKQNMYFSAVGFINDVKTGPFWEHSPMLFDISGVRTGWGKINKGMVKMYNGEVLSKFPVVQHFPFGSLFSWEQDPHAVTAPASVHTTSQSQGQIATSLRPMTDSTRAPWSHPPSGDDGAVPRMTSTPDGPTRAPWSQSASGRAAETLVARPARSMDRPTQAPANAVRNTQESLTKAPWAK